MYASTLYTSQLDPAGAARISRRPGCRQAATAARHPALTSELGCADCCMARCRLITSRHGCSACAGNRRPETDRSESLGRLCRDVSRDDCQHDPPTLQHITFFFSTSYNSNACQNDTVRSRGGLSLSHVAIDAHMACAQPAGLAHIPMAQQQ